MNPLLPPKNYRATLDQFVFIAFEAPDFKNSPLRVPFTLDDAMESLDAAVVGVASRVKNPEAQILFEKCRQEIRAAHQLYKENKIQEAKIRVYIAQGIFKQAAKLKSGSRSKDDYLVEDDGQPRYKG